MRPIASGPILKGVQAANQILAQPKGSIARASNFCYKKRGAISTIDGSKIINWYNGAVQTNLGMFEAIQLFQPINVARYFTTLNDIVNVPLAVPTGLAATLASGGSLISGQTYYYEVTALDGIGGETTASNEVSATPSGGNLSVALAWNLVTNAVAYNVYRGTTSGGERLLVGSNLPVTTNSFTDTGYSSATSYSLQASPTGAVAVSVRLRPGVYEVTYYFTTVGTNPFSYGQTVIATGVTPSAFDITFTVKSVSGNTVISNYISSSSSIGLTGGGGYLEYPVGGGSGPPPPSVNTTQQMALVIMPNVGTYPLSWTDSNIEAYFPPAPVPIQGGEPAGTGGSGGSTGGGILGGSAPTPLGGQVGNTCTLPLLVQFNDQLIIALGNGYSPQIFTDPNSIPSNVTYVIDSAVTSITENSAGTQATVVIVTAGTPMVGGWILVTNNPVAAFNGVFPIVSVTNSTTFVIAVATTGSTVGNGGECISTTVPMFNSFIPAYPAWSSSTVFALNSIIVPANTPWAPNVAYPAQSAIVASPDTGYYYVATKGGTSGGTEPTFPTTIGDTVTDGSGSTEITWTCAGSSEYYYKAIQAGESQGPTGSTSLGTVPQFPQTVGGTVKDGSVVWQNAGTIASSAPSPPGVAHTIVYAGSLWAANTWPIDHTNGIDGPCSLRMSNTNSPTNWNPINQAFLDKDDGTEIQGMATFTITAQGIPPEGSLVVFKDFATYQIQGVFGASNFTIQRVRTDMGCTSPRSIQFVPGFGVMRLTHLGIAVFDGVNDKVVSEEIRPYLFPSNDNDLSDITPMDQNYAYGAYGFQTANPPMYCLAIPVGSSQGQLTRIICYDLVTKEWGIIDLPFSIGSAVQVRAEGTIPIAMFGGFVDGVLQRWQAGDVQWYTGGTPQIVSWSFRTQEMASQVADQNLFYLRLAIRGYNTNSTASVTVTPVINGLAGPTYTSPTLPAGDFEIFAPIMVTGNRAHAIISGSGDVEIQGWSFHVEPKPAGVPYVVS